LSERRKIAAFEDGEGTPNRTRLFTISCPFTRPFAVDISHAWPYKSCNIIASPQCEAGLIGGLDGYQTKDCEEAGEESGGQSGKADPEAKGCEARQKKRQKSTWESES
jgi:hypothetical protein